MIGIYANESLSTIVREISSLYNLEIKEVTSKEELLKNSFSFVIFEVEKESNINTTYQFSNAVKEALADNFLFVSQDSTNQNLLQMDCPHLIARCILSGNATVIKQRLMLELEKLTNFTPEPTEYVQSAPIFKHEVKKAKTIAVAGVLNRSGTTTQAIQMLKYLQLNSQKVCYIEMHSNNHVKLLSQSYEEAEEFNGKVYYENCEMYFDKQQIENILKSNYDFVIFDFGVLSDENMVFFLEKDVKLLVTGATPCDINKTFSLFERIHDKDISYIFNFVHPKDHLAVQMAMGSLAKKLYFSANTPGIFYYSSENEKMHREILLPHMTFNNTSAPIEEKRKKFSFLRK